MDCSRYSDVLNEVAAGAPGSPVLNAHLAWCAHCTKELATLRQLLGIADGELLHVSEAEPSANFVPRLRSAVVKSGPVTLRPVWFWPSIATAATLVLALTLYVAGHTHHGPPEAVVNPPATAQAVPLPGFRRQPDEPVAGSAVEPELVSARPVLRVARPLVRPVEPQVLVPPGETQALIELIALVNQKKMVPELLRTSGEPSAELAALAPIAFKPIEIVPLDAALNIGT
jgi:hypothetical protein